MKRNLLIFGILALVAFLVWSAGKVPALPQPAPAETPGPPAPCEACAHATLAALTQVQINLSAQPATATVAVPGSHALATSVAAGSTQSAAQTPAMSRANVLWGQVAVVPPYAWEANTLATASAADVTRSAVQTETDLQQARLQLTSGAATQNPDAAAAQLKIDQVVSGTVAVIARTDLQAQSDITQRPTPSTVVWMWLTPIFILAAAVLTLWGVSRWQAQRRTGGQAATPR